MPTTKQINNNKDASNFDPVLGGTYDNSIPYNEATRGHWWGSEASSGISRYFLNYDDNNKISENSGRRLSGRYIRCVSEEKTVTDLTYLQDMTGEIARTMKIRFLIA